MNPIEKKLLELGLELPEASPPVANYVPYVKSGNLVFISGQISKIGDITILGRLGEDLSIEEGARQAKTLNSLLKDFHEVIANRFSGKNLSASTYLNAARRVQNQALQNLSDMVGIGHTIESLKRQGSAENKHRQLAEQNTRLHKLIDSNKELFQALTDTSIEVANIEEIGKFERKETLSRLNDLADIARQQSS